jgi:hypothetical protein
VVMDTRLEISDECPCLPTLVDVPNL